MKLIILVFFSVLCLVNPQTLSHVRVVDHVGYICGVIQSVVSEVEDRQWCNLKLPDIIRPINETVIDRHYEGTIRYTNGFVVSIQQLDILQSSVQQIWSWNNTLESGSVVLQGTLRFTDLALGYDVIVDVEDGVHWYTAIYTHPLVSFTFKIHYSIHNEAVDQITVEGTVPELRDSFPDVFPKDMTSDVIASMFAPGDVVDGIKNLAHVLQPITTQIVAAVDFPRICYDCPT